MTHRCKGKKMKKLLLLIIISFFITSFCIADEAPAELVKLIKSELVKIGYDPIIIAAVKAENAKGMKQSSKNPITMERELFLLMRWSLMIVLNPI
jgi:hypothetical protein